MSGWQINPEDLLSGPTLDVITAQVVNTGTPQTHGPYQVQGFAAIGMRADATVGRILIQLSFFADAAGSVLVGRHAVRVTNNPTRANQAMSVLGPWMIITVTDESGASSTYDLTLNVRDRVGVDQSDTNNNELVAVTASTVAAAGTLNTQANIVWPGLAHVSWLSTGTAVDVRLQFQLSTGAFRSIARWNTAAGTFLVCLPSAPVRLQYTNNDAVNRDISYYLVAQPHFTLP